MLGNNRKMGFEPFYEADSKVLILGSFPSVKAEKSVSIMGINKIVFGRLFVTFSERIFPKQ